MYRKWKRTAALGLAVLIGGMMPMGTMLAAEDNTEIVQEMDSVSDADAVPEDETISDDNESSIDEVKAEEENIGDYANTDDENAGIQVMSEPDETKASGEDVSENTAAPVIDITLNGENCKVDGLGGDISYKYTNNPNSKFRLSASLNNTPIFFYYWLDESPGDVAKDNIPWGKECSTMEWGLSSNKSYVVYVKAENNGQTVYARSCGIVVDTTAPKIVGVEEGKIYPAGTTFTVSDANLDVVKVNETPATPEQDGSYRVRANGTSCVIRAIDKAGNEKTCSITVSGSETPDTGNVISESKVYSLKAGVKYHLAAGNWKVDGDMSVYQGNSDFYVKGDGDYKFSK